MLLQNLALVPAHRPNEEALVNVQSSPLNPCARRIHWLRSQPGLPSAWSSDSWSCVIRVETAFVRGGWRYCLVRTYQAKRAASALVVPAHRRGRKSALTFAPLVAAMKAYRR
jgi:hypothetical protein